MPIDDRKLRIKATIEANKISRLSRTLQNKKMKELETQFEKSNNKKIGFMLEILRQKQDEADYVLENLVHGGEL